jgi:acyl carrier protein
MNDLRERLIKCFAAVLPQLTAEEIPLAAPTRVEGWDSLATITLVSVIEEEFAIQIDPEDIEHLASFDLVLNYLARRQAAAQG